MVLSSDILGQIMPLARRSGRVSKYYDTLKKYMEAFEINTPLRITHFLAQIAYESGELSYVEENLNYRASALIKVFPKYFNEATAPLYAGKPQKIANRVYANRMGNGDEKSGDGWKYRGRGFGQITGRDNYRAYAKWCGFDVEKNPDLLAKLPGAIRSTCWLWKQKGCNQLADKDDVTAITKKWNGGTNGLDGRKAYVRAGKKVFGI